MFKQKNEIEINIMVHIFINVSIIVIDSYKYGGLVYGF